MIPPELISNRFLLRPYNPSDEDRYVEMACDDVTIKYMGGANGSESEERELFKKIFDIYTANNTRIFWIWGIYKDGVLSGHLELKESVHTDENELEIVYIVHPECRRKGLMTEVLSLVRNSLDIWNKRIIATVGPNNIFSLKLLHNWGIEKKEVLYDQDNKEEYLKLLLTST